MSDPSQPTDQAPPRRVRKKKALPPLRGADGEQPLSPSNTDQQGIDGESNAGQDQAAPRPRRKKRLPKKQDEDELQDQASGSANLEQQLIQSDAQGPPERIKKKKRKPRQPPADEEPSAEDARRSPDGQEEGESAAPDPAIQRARHIDVEGMPLANVLETVREDVVTKGEGRINHGADLEEADKFEESDIEEDPIKLAGQGGVDNVSDTIFRQTPNARAFKAEKIEKYQQRVDEERREREQYLQGEAEEDTSNRTLKCAVGFTKVYNYIGTVLIGLMPGFALLHTAYSWLLGSNYYNFLVDYANLSQPMPILFYIALTLILLSVLDRYDTGKLDSKSCIECVSFRHAGMVILLFLPAYIISNAMYPTDLWISGFLRNQTAYVGLGSGDSIVQTWRIMDTARAALLTLGWLVVAFNTTFNKLATNLESELDDLIGDKQIELASAKEVA